MDISGHELLWIAVTGLALLSALMASISFIWRGSARGPGSGLGQIGDAAAGGIFLGVGFLHLLPEAVFAVQAQGEEPLLIFVLAGATVLFLKVLDSLGGNGGARIQALIVTLILVTHMFLTGFAMGAEDSASILLVLFVALAVHKMAEAFAFGRLLARSTIAPWLGGILLLMFVAALPIGVVAAVFTTSTDSFASAYVPHLLAVGAGTFLHFGIGHSHLLASDGSGTSLVAKATGFALIAALVLLGGHAGEHTHRLTGEHLRTDTGVQDHQDHEGHAHDR